MSTPSACVKAFAAVAFALSAAANGAQGTLATATIDASLNPVETPMGVAVANSWIVAVRGSEAECDRIRKRIDELRKDEMDAMSMHASETIDFEELCFVNFAGSSDLADKIAKEPRVKYVEPNLIMTSQGRKRKVSASGESPPSWGLNRIDQSDLPLSKNEPFKPDYSGEKVTIFVVDTGINVKHEEFDNRARYGPSFVPSESDAEDRNGHGSHCAGTAAGATFGIATAAKIVGVKVLSGGGSGSNDGVIKGIKWAIQANKDLMDDKNSNSKAGVLSMSLGGGKTQVLNDVVALAAKSMIVVVAAGNAGSDACKYSPASAGGDGRNNGPITVASTDKYDYRSGFSNYGKCTDIFAPGTDITSAWKNSATATNTISGTSMATPHVAGVAALMLEKHDYDLNKARKALFDDSVPGRIEDVRSGSTNLLLQVPLRNPGNPTPMPTRPPSNAPAQVCTTQSDCMDYAPSLFGPDWPLGKIVSGKVAAVAGNDEYGCSSVPKKSYDSDEIVVVMRGDCQFFTKVSMAESGGAKAVLIVMSSNDPIFPPNYYGNDSVGIPSLMISKSDGKDLLKNFIGKEVMIGSPTLMDGGGGGDGERSDNKRRRRRRRKKSSSNNSSDENELIGTPDA